MNKGVFVVALLVLVMGLPLAYGANRHVMREEETALRIRALVLAKERIGEMRNVPYEVQLAPFVKVGPERPYAAPEFKPGSVWF
jgi:hypothetical protein